MLPEPVRTDEVTFIPEEPEPEPVPKDAFDTEPSPPPPVTLNVEEAVPATSPVTLSKEDLLEAENLAMRIQLQVRRREDIIAEANQHIADLDKALVEQRAAITVLQRRLQAKYNIDFTKQQIEPGTGRVIPAPTRP